MFLPFFSQDLLTRHKIMCADFLEKNYDRVSSVHTCIFGSLSEKIIGPAEFNLTFSHLRTGFHRIREAPAF